MLRIIAVTKDHKIQTDLDVKDVKNDNIKWYWVDFDQPTEEETKLLSSFFNFHPLAIEDCMYFIQRPKLDHFYEGTDAHHSFFVIHSVNEERRAEEIDCFFGENFLVSYHKNPSNEVLDVYKKLIGSKNLEKENPIKALHSIMDNVVDMYFPIIYKIEDLLNEVEDNKKGLSTAKLMEDVFEIRSDLVSLRKTIIPMRDLLYRITNSNRIHNIEGHKPYFTDIYDHLLKLTEMLEANRDLTADIRDSYISLNSNKMNQIMMTLTVITTIFMPLTFIAGIYGMNFKNMPELNWNYGYFIVIIAMIIIGIGMGYWFKRKGWFKEF